MSKSAIYTAMTTPTAIAVGDLLPIGATVRRFGCSITQDGNTVTLRGSGYYKITVSATVEPTAAGTVSVTLNKDGVAVIGATAQGAVATAENPINLTVSAIVRNTCDCESSILSLTLGETASTLTNLAVTVVKL